MILHVVENNGGDVVKKENFECNQRNFGDVILYACLRPKNFCYNLFPYDISFTNFFTVTYYLDYNLLSNYTWFFIVLNSNIS